MDKTQKNIELLREKLTDYFASDNTGHGIDHLERALKYALLLQKKEGGDKDVIAVSAFIHDVHRIMGDIEGRFVTPEESLPVVKKLIENLDLTSDQKEHILYAVKHHEEYSFGKEKISVTDIESLILQDADNLDAIGAIGIMRAVKYGTANKMPDYDPTIPFYNSEYTESVNDKSTIHHLYNKPLRLGKYLNTVTARKIAEEKTDLVKRFIELYIKEYNCDF